MIGLTLASPPAHRDARGGSAIGMRMRSRRGFTLLEMMIAIVLFAVGTLAVMELFHRAQAGSSDGENILIATRLAQARMEELRNVAYDDLDEANETKASIESPAGFAQFDREVTVTEPYANLSQVVVTVYWDASGGETSVSLQTYRSNI